MTRPTEPADPGPPPLPVAPAPLGRGLGTFLLVLLWFLTFGAQALFAPALRYFPAWASLVENLANLAPLAIAALVAFGLRPREALGLRPVSPRLAGIVGSLGLANLLVVGFLVTLLLLFVYPPEMVREEIRTLSSSLLVADTLLERVLLFLTIAVTAPIAEELFYRGLLQNLLVRWWGPAAGILVATTLFALAHVLPTRLPAVFEIGLVLGIVYHLTGSIVACVLVHAVNNAVVSLAYVWPEAHAFLLGPAGFLAGVPFLVVVVRLFLREVRGRERPARPQPREFRATRLFALMLPCWVAGYFLASLAGPLAGPGGRALAQARDRIEPLVETIDDRFATDAAWTRFVAIRSAVRGSIKRGDTTVDEYLAWLERLRNETTVPLEGLEPDYRATEPIEEERQVLDRIREDAKSRFGVEIPEPIPFP